MEGKSREFVEADNLAGQDIKIRMPYVFAVIIFITLKKEFGVRYQSLCKFFLRNSCHTYSFG
jgi:hypothetical protein